jgi:protein TonB
MSQLSSACISRYIGAATAIALHAIALALLMDFVAQPLPMQAPRPIMVSLITPEAAPQPKADTPPRPLPVAPLARPKLPPPPLPAPPVLTAAAEAPTQATAPPPPVIPTPVAPIEAAPAPAPPAPPAPPAVIPPSFNAAYLRNPPPVYPSLARRGGQQGRVVLRVLVNPAGTADQVVVRTSSGYSLLDNAAREVVYQWRFVPARKGDQAITEWVLVPINFSLEG